MNKTAQFLINVQYDDSITDPEIIELGLETLINNAIQTSMILEECGNPEILDISLVENEE